MKKFFLVYILFNLLSFSLEAAQTGSIMLDASTGKVFHAENADSKCFPASLTKMMTLYLLFEAIENGKTNLFHRMPVSRHAAAQEPTKIHVKKGQRLLVKHAIQALAVKSANDAAVVVAEFLGGTEKEFAKKMTRKARELGMSNTTFKNASGLPNPLQKSTPRDMAKLSLALMRHFPKYFKYFATKTFKYRGKTYRNHNRMLYTYTGCTGLKTGYTRASGFNLAATATREKKKLVGVVVGEKSPGKRAARMARLFNASFKKLGVRAKGASCKLSAPSGRFAVCNLPNLKQQQARYTSVIYKNELNLPPAQKLTTVINTAPPSTSSDFYLDVGTYQNYAKAEEFMKKALILGNDLVTRDNFKIDSCIEGNNRYRVKIIDLSNKAIDDLSEIYKTYRVPCLKLLAKNNDEPRPQTLKETRIEIAKAKALKDVRPKTKPKRKIKATSKKPKRKVKAPLKKRKPKKASKPKKRKAKPKRKT